MCTCRLIGLNHRAWGVGSKQITIPKSYRCRRRIRDKPLNSKMISFGEVGLSGEIRPVPDGEQRLREAAGHGYTQALIPAANIPRKALDGLQVVPLSHVSHAVEKVF